MFDQRTLVLADYEKVVADAEAKNMRLSSRIVSESTFDFDTYRDELERAEENTQVGMRVLYENERVRVWRIELEPGDRVPFHTHRNPYVWICTDGTTGAHRENDGKEQLFDYHPDEIDYLPIRPGEKLIHDLENVGDARLGFIVVELLS
jgi:quercetin dioxygenase-like cupin family protein